MCTKYTTNYTRDTRQKTIFFEKQTIILFICYYLKYIFAYTVLCTQFMHYRYRCAHMTWSLFLSLLFLTLLTHRRQCIIHHHSLQTVYTMVRSKTLSFLNEYKKNLNWISHVLTIAITFILRILYTWLKYVDVLVIIKKILFSKLDNNIVTIIYNTYTRNCVVYMHYIIPI